MSKPIPTIADWKGNEIKEGMEICFVQTVIHNSKMSWLMPKGGGKFVENVLCEASDEPCWILSEYYIVEKDGNRLFVPTVTKGAGELKGYTFHSRIYLGEKNFFENNPTMAIKGISDTNPNALPSQNTPPY